MALFTCDIQKFYLGEYWTNRYILSTGTIQAAEVNGLLIVAAEQSITNVAVSFTSMRVADQDPLTDLYIITPLSSTGQRATPGTTLLPLFNCVRVDFPASQGRPSRKYLRGVLTEDDIAFNNLTTDLVSLVQSEYAIPLGENNTYVDIDGQALEEGQVITQVAMRQLRRGSKRKAKPVIPTS